MAKRKKTEQGGGRRKPRDDRAAAVRKAQILKALAHPARVLIFEAVAARELTVGEIATLLGAKESITSRHLAVMRAAGLVAARKEGLKVHYSSKMSCLSAVMPCLEEAVCTMADEQGRIASGLRREGRI
jgi:DNA-binding transcriptional ArsR family regulator